MKQPNSMRNLKKKTQNMFESHFQNTILLYNDKCASFPSEHFLETEFHYIHEFKSSPLRKDTRMCLPLGQVGTTGDFKQRNDLSEGCISFIK